MTEVISGIYEYALSNNINGGIGEIHIYVIPGGPGKRTLMIDAGFVDRECVNKTIQELASIGVSVDMVDVFLTHEHYDHSGMAAELSKRGARIFMNPEEENHHYTCLYHRKNFAAYEEQVRVLRTVGVTPEETPELWQQYVKSIDAEEQTPEKLLWVIEKFDYIPVYPGQVFAYGDYTFHAFSLRGHSAGQMGLYDEEREVVFLADQVLNGIVPIVSTSYEGENLLESFFKSLEEIKMRFTGWTILPAHAGQIADLSEQIEHISTSYLDKLDHISQIVNHLEIPETVCQIACKAYGIKRMPASDGEFVKVKFIITKTFSCLEYLSKKGLITKTKRDDILYWGPGKAQK